MQINLREVLMSYDEGGSELMQRLIMCTRQVVTWHTTHWVVGVHQTPSRSWVGLNIWRESGDLLLCIKSSAEQKYKSGLKVVMSKDCLVNCGDDAIFIKIMMKVILNVAFLTTESIYDGAGLISKNLFGKKFVDSVKNWLILLDS